MDAHVLRTVVSAVTLALVVTPSASEPWQERTLSVADRGTLVLFSPRAWVQQTNQSPPSIRFSNSSGQKFVVFITAQWSPTQDSSFNSPVRLHALIEDTAAKISPQAVERTIPIDEINGTDGRGYYFSATDKAPAPDEYKYLTQGALAVDDLLLRFTVLTNETESSVVNDALNMVRSARRGT
ncbi:MAG TPA: hypothetical protein VJS64_02920 [Pyrinomonadaceae bacterium]|nr:hypothetical protein [Pyrinomonadaceae bacterium]